MSALAHGQDDHPEAARKHAVDARTLLIARRADGAAYLAGYVVECAVKAIVLHDRAYCDATRTTDAAILAQWHQTLKRSYRHDLGRLLTITLGPTGAAYAQYLPPQTTKMTRDWSEAIRYQAENAVSLHEAESYVEWASLAEMAVVQMKLDGVL